MAKIGRASDQPQVQTMMPSGNHQLPPSVTSPAASPSRAAARLRTRTWSAGNVSSAVVSEAQQSYLSSCSESSHGGRSEEDDDGDQFLDVNVAAANIARLRHPLPPPQQPHTVAIEIPPEMRHVVIRHSRSNLGDGDGDDDDAASSDISSLEVDVATTTKDVTCTHNNDPRPTEKMASSALQGHNNELLLDSEGKSPGINESLGGAEESGNMRSRFWAAATSRSSHQYSSTSMRALCGLEGDDEGDRSEMSYSLSTNSRLQEKPKPRPKPRRRGHKKNHSKCSLAGLSLNSVSIGGLSFVDTPGADYDLCCSNTEAERPATGRSDVKNRCTSPNDTFNTSADSMASLLLDLPYSLPIQPILASRGGGDLKGSRQNLCHRRHRSENILQLNVGISRFASFGPPLTNLRMDGPSSNADSRANRFHRRSVSAGCGIDRYDLN